MSFYKEFPNLQAKEIKLDNDVQRIKAEIKEVKTNPRYDSNESERKYQMEQLEQQLEKTLADAEEDFQLELQATELHLAEQAFKMPDASEEERGKAKELASIIKTQLIAAPNIDDTLELLKTRIKSMSDAEKQALKIELVSSGIEGLGEIMQALNDTAHMRDISQQQYALKQIKLGSNSLRRKYDVFDSAVKKSRGGVI